MDTTSTSTEKRPYIAFKINKNIFQSDTKKNSLNFGLNKIPFDIFDKKSIFLLNPSYEVNFFKFMQSNFTITTKKGSAKFNIDLLRESSSIISDFIQNNPDNFEFNLDIDDKLNVLSKFERLYKGETVSITPNDIPVYSQIINLLKLSISDETAKKDESFDLVIKKKRFNEYIQTKGPQFVIETNKKSYSCNIFGVRCSNVFNENIVENPKLIQCQSDFNDENEEFQLICDIFNFKEVQITKDNIDFLKGMAETLQIDCVLDEINRHLETLDVIDDSVKSVDAIDELMKKLHNIDKEKVEKVRRFIVDSLWSKEEENVKELACYILQAATTEVRLNSRLSDLIFQLKNEANETNKLDVLVGSIEENVTTESFPLLADLYIQKVIKKDELKNDVKKMFLQNHHIISSDFDEGKILKISDSDDDVTKALICDDVSELKSLIEKAKIDVSTATVKTSLIESNYIDCAAFYGSVKCFEYLVSMNQRADLLTFQYALFGGNDTIIQKVEQFHLSPEDKGYQEKMKMSDENEELVELIENHGDIKEDIKDVETRDEMEKLITIGLKNGNPQPFIESIDNGYDFEIEKCKCIQQNLLKKGKTFPLEYRAFEPVDIACSKIINKATQNGFYNLSELLFKIITTKNHSFNIDTCLISAVFNHNLNFFIKLFESIQKKGFYFDKDNVESILAAAIESKKIDIFDFLFKKVQTETPSLLNSLDFTPSIETTLFSDSIEMFKYLINKKIKIDFDRLLQNPEFFDKLNKEFVQLIAKNFTEKGKTQFYSIILDQAFEKKNIEIIEFVLNSKVQLNDESQLLFKAVKTQSLEIVDLVLKKDSEPFFVNKIMPEGTALSIAVENDDPQIVKRLLSVPKIKTYFNENEETPLIIATKRLNTEIMDMFFNFYGENIHQEEMNEVIKILLPKLYSEEDKPKLYHALNKILAIKSIDPNIMYDSKSLLFYAAEKNEIEIVRNLLKLEKTNTNINDPENGNTPLMVATIKGNVEIAKLLISDSRTDVNIENYDNENAKTIALQNDQVEIFDYLNRSKLVFATERNNVKLVDSIINDQSFDPIESDIENAILIAYNKDFRTIYSKLSNAIKSSDNDELKERICFDTFKIACENCDSEMIMKTINSPYFSIISYNIFDLFIILFIEVNTSDRFVDILSALYDYGQEHNQIVDFNQKLQNGRLLLTFLSPETNNISDVVNFLLNHEADPNAMDDFGIYPLQYAISIKSNPFINALIDSPMIDLTKIIKNSNNMSLLELIRSECNEEIKNKVLHLEPSKNIKHSLFTFMIKNEPEPIELIKLDHHEIIGKHLFIFNPLNFSYDEVYDENDEVSLKPKRIVKTAKDASKKLPKPIRLTNPNKTLKSPSETDNFIIPNKKITKKINESNDLINIYLSNGNDQFDSINLYNYIYIIFALSMIYILAIL